MGKRRELKGQKFGRLTVICEYTKNNRAKNDKNIYWICKCECGSEKKVITTSTKLINGHTKSCGCYQKYRASICNSSHRETKTRLYNIWQGIKRRCNNKNAINYKNYGLRGIKMCTEWENDFMLFKDWAYQNGYNANLTIDRIDNDKNYCPSNCIWSDQKYQQNHKRNNRYITYNNQKHTLSEWAQITGLSTSVIDSRLNKLEWSEQKTLTTPLRGKNNVSN